MRKVRAVSIGASMIAETADETKLKINVALGEATVRISSAEEGAVPTSGKPMIADRRLRMKVLSVGRSSEYINVTFVAFHTDVGPLVDHSCEMTSINEEGLAICRRCLGVVDD
jgi:hypothetical protein